MTLVKSKTIEHQYELGNGNYAQISPDGGVTVYNEDNIVVLNGRQTEALKYSLGFYDLPDPTEDRQKELSYIATVLGICQKANASDLRDELADLRAWLANRRTCYPVKESAMHSGGSAVPERQGIDVPVSGSVPPKFAEPGK